MRKESIRIHNFGPLREVVLEDIRPMTVIIGPSGVGKSTILKVVSLFRWILKMIHIRTYLRRSGMKRSPFRLMMSSYIKQNGWIGFVSPETSIEYHFGGTEISFKDNKLSYHVSDDEPLHLEKVSFIADSRIIIPDILALKAKSDEFYTNETLEDFKMAMDSLESVDLPYLGVRASSKKKGGRQVYQITDSDDLHPIPLENASSGTQTVLPIVAISKYFTTRYDLVASLNHAILSYVASYDKFTEMRFAENISDIPSRRVSLMIEEPELSLSPEMQISFLNDLCRDCFVNAPHDYDMGLFMTTHSPYIVNQLNLLILAGDKGLDVEGASLRYEDLEVYRLTHEEGLVSLKSINKQFVDSLPLSESISRIYEQYRSLLDLSPEK